MSLLTSGEALHISDTGQARGCREATNSNCGYQPGFAHGFLVMSDSADLMYKCTEYYAPEFERILRWNDPSLSIDWPLDSELEPIVSERDAAGKSFGEAESYE